MKKLIYPSQYTYNKTSVLPVELQKICSHQCKPDDARKYAIQDAIKLSSEFAKLGPAQIGQVEREVRRTAGFYSYFYEPDIAYSGKSPAEVQFPEKLALIKSFPELSYLYLFHGNGWLRQAALDNLNCAPTGPFEIAAIIHRLNDWVPQVRAAALNYCRRIFDSIPHNIVAQVAPFILEKLWVYKRWGGVEKTVLEAFIFEPKVMEEFAKILQGQNIANVSLIFRLAFQRPGLDDHLGELAFEANSPIVRSIAYRALLSKQVNWPIGYERVWIDKPSGISQQNLVMASRSINHRFEVELLLEKGALDRAVVVRRVVAQELIDRLPSCPQKAVELAEQFLSDKSQSVRTRAEYFLKHQPTKSPT